MKPTGDGTAGDAMGTSGPYAPGTPGAVTGAAGPSWTETGTPGAAVGDAGAAMHAPGAAMRTPGAAVGPAGASWGASGVAVGLAEAAVESEGWSESDRSGGDRTGGGMAGGAEPGRDAAARRGDGTGRPLGGELVAVAIVAGLAGTAGWGFHRVFAAAGLLPVVVVAAVAPAVVSLLLRSRPLWLSLAVHVVLWPLVATAMLFRDGAVLFALPTPATLGAIVSGVVDAPRALLATILPAPDEGRLLVLVHLLVWVAALIGVEFTLRGATRAVPALPAVAVFGVALLLGVDGPGGNLPVAAALLGLMALLLVARSGRSPLWAAAAVPAVAALAAVAMLVAPLLPIAATPFDPRAYVEQPPPAPVDSVSPLDRVSAWLQIPDTPLFTVTAGSPQNWRLAVLDRYDGVRWTSSGAFQTTGGRVPEADEPWARQGRYDTVEQQITLGRLPGRWLPAADRPASVSGVQVVVDPASGSLMATGRLSDGLGYQVVSRIPRYAKAELRNAVPASGDAAALAVPDGARADRFRRIAQTATRGARLPFQQAVLLQKYLRTRAKYDVTAPPGHSMAGLEFFLRTSRRGTSEQFASAFAVLARTLGLPSRVVVGFRPGARSGGSYHVMSGDVLAWPEIEFDGLGWVAFDPTPARSGAAADHDVASASVKERQELEQELGDTSSDPARPSAKPVRPNVERDTSPGVSPSVVGGAAAALIVAAYLLLAVAAPVLRRWRRRRGGPRDRVIGAWRQTCDDLGLPPGRADGAALTAAEVSERAARALGPDVTPHIVPLARLCNFTRFAPEPAPGGLSAEVADEAWRRSDAVRGVVRRHTPPLRRLGRRLHPRSLRLR